MKRAKRKKGPVQRDLWGNPIEAARPTASTEVIPLDFESHAVRMIVKGGEPWWVLADVARVLGYRDAADASKPLRDRHKGTHLMRTLGGTQEMVVVNEPGLYRLMMRSNKPEAERFQDWVTDEVLPTIRKTGGYSLRKPLSRVEKTARRLRCDTKTAEVRCENAATNKSINKRMASEGAKPNDFKKVHRAFYTGQFKAGITTIRTTIEITSRQTPLDHMDAEALGANLYAKLLADRIIREQGIPLAHQAEVAEAVASSVAEVGLQHLGGRAQFGVTEDPKRGPVIGVVRPSLN